MKSDSLCYSKHAKLSDFGFYTEELSVNEALKDVYEM